MEDNCFTVLCWFLSTTWTSHKYRYVPFLWNLPPNPHPIPPHQVITEHLVEFPALHSSFPLAIYFTDGNVSFSVLLLQSLSPSPSPAASTSLPSASASLFLPCKLVHQYHFSRVHVYALICDISFFSLWIASLCVTGSWFIHLIRIDTNAFLLMAG